MKKTLYKDIALLDARRVTPEIAQEIEGIQDVATLLLTPQSQRALKSVTQSDIAAVIVLPQQAQLSMVNGQCTLSAGQNGPVFLVVNGQLEVDAHMRPEEIAQTVCGGLINGQVMAGKSQMQALFAAGVQVNGQTFVHPDGFTPRSGQESLTRAQVLAMAAGCGVYLRSRALVEGDALREMAARGVRLAGEAIVREGDAALMGEVYEGDLGACIFVPDGMRVHMGSLHITRLSALTVPGELCVLGEVVIESDVKEAMLAGLSHLEVRGRLTVPVELVDTLMGRVGGNVEWTPYEGRLLRGSGEWTLDAGMLDGEAGVTVYNKGVLNMEEALSPDVLRAQVKAMINRGVVRGEPEQLRALRAAALEEGVLETHACEEAPPQEAAREDVILVGDMASFMIG